MRPARVARRTAAAMSPQGQHAIDVYRAGQNPIASPTPGGPMSFGGGQAVARAAPYAMNPQMQQFMQGVPQMLQQMRSMVPPTPQPQMPPMPPPMMQAPPYGSTMPVPPHLRGGVKRAPV